MHSAYRLVEHSTMDPLETHHSGNQNRDSKRSVDAMDHLESDHKYLLHVVPCFSHFPIQSIGRSVRGTGYRALTFEIHSILTPLATIL